MIPVFVLSGFLGSGKTTLLMNILDHVRNMGKRPAVIMNEIGDVHLDGTLIDADVPMSQLLSGCICCTIREDLSSTLLQIVHQNQADVIVIESTGIANPLELIEGVTNASLIVELELKLVITVVSAPHYFELSGLESNKTVRLMEEQIRCADLLLLNKVDLMDEAETRRLHARLADLNSGAQITETVRCKVDPGLLSAMGVQRRQNKDVVEGRSESTGHHHSHNHVMAYTHRFRGLLDHKKFERLFKQIPAEVYRAKGIIQFAKDQGIYLFQYAYREFEIVKINPQQKVQNVAVFIGEHFDKNQVRDAVEQLYYEKTIT
ncbi:GTP-binding protein [Paenibacillus sp. TRM 82003]|nr:GTP-binding protein [Paenibacillus sp. TRM 82003]